METQPKRRRLDATTAAHETGLSCEVFAGESRAHVSSHFEGAGISNANGIVQVNGDFVLNSGPSSKKTDPSNARSMLVQSLQFDQMNARHSSIKKAHANTCSWVVQTESYKQWEEQGSPQSKFLWIKGKPGAGKSTLMKFLFGQKEARIRKMRSHIRLISFFFNARGNDLEKSIVGMYRSLLFQLLDPLPELGHLLNNLPSNHQWTVESLKSLFEESIQELKDTSVVCVIDALDECDENEIRDMIRFLSGLIETGSRLSVCFASRHYPHITVETGLSIILEERDEHQHDITTYLSSALQIGQGTLAEQISSALQKKACGVFMWVVLVVDILNREYDAGRKHSLAERLQQLPGDLHALFRDILTRDLKNQQDLLLCIQWVLFAKHPLTPKQLYLAILSGSEPGHLPGCHSDEYSEDVVRKYILSTSKGLAESTKSKIPTIQFIHESVRDFLLKEDGLSKVFPNLDANICGWSHEALKKCCLTYMSMEELLKLQGSPRDESIERFPLLEYANNGVLYHSDQAHNHEIRQDDFLTGFPQPAWVEHHNVLQKHQVRCYTPKVTLLYILAEAGMSALVRAHPRRQSCFEVEDERYGCPILAATTAKNNTTVEVMLELEAERLPNFSFSNFRQSLPLDLSISYAPSRRFTYNKKRELFSQLVRHGNELVSLFWLATHLYDIDGKKNQGKTVLMLAVVNDFGALVNRLLQLRADSSYAGRYGHTLLHLASAGGRVEAAKALLDHGVNVSVVNNSGETPLHQASKNGKFEVAQLLISHDANISAADKNGGTPLHEVSWNGSFEVAKLLISHHANLSAANNHGNTPLHRASASPFDKPEVAKLLIDHGANISAANNAGETPLHQASTTEKLEVVKLLIDHGADVSATDNYGTTPLHQASHFDEFEIAMLLISHGANVLAVDSNGDTPLHTASPWEKTLSRVAKLLIEHGSDVSAVNNQGIKAVDRDVHSI